MVPTHCHRCGLALAPTATACARCGTPRRAAPGATVPVLSYARPTPKPFHWVWCHFFRNACFVAAVACVGIVASGAASRRERPIYAVTTIAFVALAIAFHVWHERVCRRGSPRR